MTSDTHFLVKLVAAAPASFAALAAVLQHFVAELFSAAPFRFLGPMVLRQVAPAASDGRTAAAGAAGAGAAGAGAGAGAGAVCASATPTTQKEAKTIAIVFIVRSLLAFPVCLEMPPQRLSYVSNFSYQRL